MKHWPLLLLAAASLATGCSTTTIMHYDLQPITDTVPSNQSKTLVKYQLASIDVPESLDVETLIVRQPNNSLMVLSHDKWVAPLSQVIQNSLSVTLTQSLGTPPMPSTMLLATESSASANSDKIFVDMQQFEMQPAKLASIGALWQIDFAGKPGQIITCYSVLSRPVTPGVAALVTAQQQNMQQLGQQIANTLQTGTPPQEVKCQVQKT
ncbi:PqiC family protein [Orrella daihaiensis]|uniref:Membrane integrity-associated transporter subunit PqiC n=1 Tax=Orrella daihaiensis TaxID=2782176 RepID=A0ABY4AKB5_9BURK|nr:ABC-type transport auxiliary lipoprotein family protein [Orrella daihaiensis]UOD50096.1 membrane integrity-associated transporter subunit PqiC [Orrella daihaiensis]